MSDVKIAKLVNEATEKFLQSRGNEIATKVSSEVMSSVSKKLPEIAIEIGKDVGIKVSHKAAEEASEKLVKITSKCAKPSSCYIETNF